MNAASHENNHLSPAQKRVLQVLKRQGPLSPNTLADQLQITDVAARQHLAALEAAHFVSRQTQPPSGRGRPQALWALTDQAQSIFPDTHAELTVGILNAIQNAVGKNGLLKVINQRAQDQIVAYQNQMPPPSASLRKRVEALATIRTNEGYMAEVIEEKPGTYLLIEHHCPICTAATACQNLCTAELEIFQHLLTDKISIERIEHLLKDADKRCTYRIQNKKK